MTRGSRIYIVYVQVFSLFELLWWTKTDETCVAFVSLDPCDIRHFNELQLFYINDYTTSLQHVWNKCEYFNMFLSWDELADLLSSLGDYLVHVPHTVCARFRPISPGWVWDGHVSAAGESSLVNMKNRKPKHKCYQYYPCHNNWWSRRWSAAGQHWVTTARQGWLPYSLHPSGR